MVPIPIEVEAKDTGLITILSIRSLYFTIAFSVLFGVKVKLIAFEVDIPWLLSVITVVSNLVAVPVIFLFTVVNLWVDPPVVPTPTM